MNTTAKRIYKLGDVICEEHGTRLGDEDLVACCKAAFPDEWDGWTEQEQFACQVGWVAPMPRFSR